MQLAQQQRSQAFTYSLAQGGKIIPIDSNKSFVVWWQPENFDPATGTVLVSLHGHAEWAVKDFEIWHPELVERGYAYLGVQWWFGQSLEPIGYYEPDQIYAIIVEQLAQHTIPPGNVIFEGFSMGSARSYAVTLRDTLCGPQYFGVTIANAGQWEDDYSSNVGVLAGQYGESPYAGTDWILFCGGQDKNEYAKTNFPLVCDGMEHTKEVLTRYGGTVDLLLKDPTGDHGSFSLNPDNRDQVLNAAESILRK